MNLPGNMDKDPYQTVIDRYLLRFSFYNKIHKTFFVGIKLSKTFVFFLRTPDRRDMDKDPFHDGPRSTTLPGIYYIGFRDTIS